MSEEETSWFGDAFGKRTPDEQIEVLREHIREVNNRIDRKIREEREARGFLAKRVRKLEKQNNLLIQAVLIAVGIFGASQTSHYWKLGEWWNVLALIAFGIIAVKVFSDSQKDN